MDIKGKSKLTQDRENPGETERRENIISRLAVDDGREKEGGLVALELLSLVQLN